MAQESKKGTPDQKIASTAKDWRQVERQAIADKGDTQLQRAEYHLRKQLRKAIDEAGHP